MYRRILSLTVLLALALAAMAQDKPLKEDKKTEEPVVIKASLPKGWKSLGLTDTQKKEVLTTRAKYAVKRQKLEEQLKALKAEEMESLEKILTDAQKQRLKELKK
jgi:hypothetical protein